MNDQLKEAIAQLILGMKEDRIPLCALVRIYKLYVDPELSLHKVKSLIENMIVEESRMILKQKDMDTSRNEELQKVMDLIA